MKTSEYLLDTAKDHIEGKITIDEAQKRIHSYYEQRTTRTETENETKEADIVSARITKLLGEKAFQFSPAEWITIHHRLFEGIFDHAGQIRKYNISKKEWILNGETVIYADFNNIKDTLDYDFATEKQFSYEGLSVEASVKHLAKFASDIWRIHPFGEGNTRATAVFMIKYEKQHHKCAICGEEFEFEDMHADHIKAWSKGGHTTPENCQMLCRDCNLEKGNQ